MKNSTIKFFLLFSVIFFLLVLFFDSLFTNETLKGDWDFYLKKTPSQVFDSPSSNIKIQVPAIWNDTIFNLTDSSDPKTYATFRYKKQGLTPNTKYALLIKDSPATSCAVYVNKDLIKKNGDPFAMVLKKPFSNKHSVIKPIYCEFYSDQAGCADIAILVANHFYRKSGILDTVIFGTKNDVFRTNIILLTFYTFTAGVLLFLGLFNIAQSIIIKDQKAFFYQGLLSLACATRVLTAEYCSLAIIIPSLTAIVKYKLEYIIFWLSPIAVIQMLHELFPEQKRILFIPESFFRKPIIFASFLLGIVSLILPAKYLSFISPVLKCCTAISSAYVLSIISFSIIKKEKFISFYFIGFIVLIVGGAFDYFCRESKGAVPALFFPFVLTFFNFIQILALVEIQNEVYKNTKKISGELKKLNEAYLRFVPKEFLKLLNKDSATNIKLGDFSKIQMCIMFSKFTIQTKDNIAPEYHFKIFNDCLKRVSPVIAFYGGFISKFLSGGIMALFPKNETDALLSAIKIKKIVDDVNKKNKEFNVKVWIGLHFGKMIIGTIGEENRMDDTVISDTVNTSARIESVCEKLEKNIIVSKVVYDKLNFKKLKGFSFEKLQAVSVKGKEEPLELYACIERKFL